MIATPHNRSGELALEIYGAVLDGIRGEKLVRDSVRLDGDLLHVQDLRLDLSASAPNAIRRLFVCGSGKASYGMAKALTEVLGDRVSGGLVVTKHGHGGPLSGLELIEASHPVPDESSLAAGRRMLEFAATVGEGDLVLYVLSGGTSALMEVLPDGVELGELQKLTDRLLSSGIDIQRMNALRSQISCIKRGRLGSAFAPARVVVLVLSDVAYDDLGAIGSGPFWNSQSNEQIPSWVLSPPSLMRPLEHASYGTRKGSPPMRSYSILRQLRLDKEAAASIENLLRRFAQPEEPLGAYVSHRFVGTSLTASQLAHQKAHEIGIRLDCESWAWGRSLIGANPSLNGEVREVAKSLVWTAKRLEPEPLSISVHTGEPTVVLRGDGAGGRCQELAARVAIGIAGMPGLAVLAGSTDGTDGPTDVAGGLVDGESVQRATANGVDVNHCLDNSDSNRFLAACGGLIKTGPTQSNLNDVVIIVRSN